MCTYTHKFTQFFFVRSTCSLPQYTGVECSLSINTVREVCSSNLIYTPTHVCFCELWGHYIGIMVFILYKPYFLSPYTNPTPKPTPYRKYGDMGKYPHKSSSPCNTYVIPMSLYKCVSSYVTNTHTHTHTHTHTLLNQTESGFDVAKLSQNSGLLVVPRIAKSTKGGRAFSYLAPKLWNSLPDNVRGSDTLSLFKSRLKTHLFCFSVSLFLLRN